MTEHEQAILEQAYRFGFARPELSTFIPSLGSDAHASALLDQLQDHGYLSIAPLYCEQSYCYFTKTAASRFELPATDIGPFSEREKLCRFAMFHFCLKTGFRPLTETDFERHFPELYSAQTSTGPRRHQPRWRDYYHAPPAIGFLRVDNGGRGGYYRLLKNVLHRIAIHKRLFAYAELISQERFQAAIVTPFETKAQRIRDDIADAQPEIPIRVCVVPQLVYFLAPPKEVPRSA